MHSHIEVFQAVCQLVSVRPPQPRSTTKARKKWDCWAGGGVGVWVGSCFINLAHHCLIQFERPKKTSLDLVDGWRCARIIMWENDLIDKRRKKIIHIRSRCDVRRMFTSLPPANTPSASASPSRCIFWCKRFWKLRLWRTIHPHRWKTRPRSLQSKWRQTVAQRLLVVNKSILRYGTNLSPPQTLGQTVAFCCDRHIRLLRLVCLTSITDESMKAWICRCKKDVVCFPILLLRHAGLLPGCSFTGWIEILKHIFLSNVTFS